MSECKQGVRNHFQRPSGKGSELHDKCGLVSSVKAPRMAGTLKETGIHEEFIKSTFCTKTQFGLPISMGFSLFISPVECTYSRDL